MADVKHTPGPWTSHRALKPDNVGGFDYAIQDEYGHIIAEAFEVVGGKKGTYIEKPAAANARLIEAAPDLLEACKAAKTELAYLIEQVGARPGGSVHVAFDKCLAAITKSEGDE